LFVNDKTVPINGKEVRVADIIGIDEKNQKKNP
jgi:hypothetical protein